MTSTANSGGINRRAVLAGAAGLAAAAPLGAGALPAGERPNIVWIVSEDNNPFIGAYGDRTANTPNIDRLAGSGILYRRAYSNAPVCAPSRFGILTGTYPESCSPAQHMRADARAAGILPCYPELLRGAGYYCTNNVKTDYNCDIDPAKVWDESSARAHWKNRPAGKPFMAVFNLMTTHESQNFKPTEGKVKPADVRVPPFMPDTPTVRRDIASYYNRMEIMDGQVGKLLAELDAAGLSDNTIVFYYSDNGGILIRSKRYCYEEGLRCALIARVPARWAHMVNARAGQVVETPVSFIDLAPTVLSLAGVPVPPTMQGTALMGRAARQLPGLAFGMRNRMDERYDFVRTVTDGRYRYIRNYLPHLPHGQNMSFEWLAGSYQELDALRIAGKLDPVQQRFFEPRPYEELYELSADPDELVNLAGDRRHARALGTLRRALDRHLVAINDNGFIPEGSRIEGWVASRARGAYPLRRIMALAQAAARGDARKGPLLRKSLGDSHEVVRFWAATGLAILAARDEPALERLRSMAKGDPVLQVRVAAGEALARCGDAAAVPVLAALLESGTPDPVRLQALNVLTRMGTAAAPAMPHLRQLAAVQSDYLPRAARYLIQVIEGTYDPYNPIFDLDGFRNRNGSNTPDTPYNPKG